MGSHVEWVSVNPRHDYFSRVATGADWNAEHELEPGDPSYVTPTHLVVSLGNDDLVNITGTPEQVLAALTNLLEKVRQQVDESTPAARSTEGRGS